MSKIGNKIRGIFTVKDKLAPAYISIKNPKFIEIDNMYYSGIIIVNYNRVNTELILKKFSLLVLEKCRPIFYNYYIVVSFLDVL